MVDRVGTVLLDRPGDPGSVRPEVDCGELRQLLLDALPCRAVRWGCKVAGVSATEVGHQRVAKVSARNLKMFFRPHAPGSVMNLFATG